MVRGGEIIGLSMKAITKVKGIIGAEPWKYTPLRPRGLLVD